MDGVVPLTVTLTSPSTRQVTTATIVYAATAGWARSHDGEVRRDGVGCQSMGSRSSGSPDHCPRPAARRRRPTPPSAGKSRSSAPRRHVARRRRPALANRRVVRCGCRRPSTTSPPRSWPGSWPTSTPTWPVRSPPSPRAGTPRSGDSARTSWSASRAVPWPSRGSRPSSAGSPSSGPFSRCASRSRCASASPAAASRGGGRSCRSSPAPPCSTARTSTAPRSAVALGRFLAALHVPAPADAPRSEWRGIPVAARADTFDELVVEHEGDPSLDVARRAWTAALDAPPHDAAPTWVHGDLHPGNVLVDADGGLVAVLDFNDLNAGDPATDLAACWLLLEPEDTRRRARRLRPCGRRAPRPREGLGRALRAALPLGRPRGGSRLHAGRP